MNIAEEVGFLEREELKKAETEQEPDWSFQNDFCL